MKRRVERTFQEELAHGQRCAKVALWALVVAICCYSVALAAQIVEAIWW